MALFLCLFPVLWNRDFFFLILAKRRLSYLKNREVFYGAVADGLCGG